MLKSQRRNRGVHRVAISIQISALAGVKPRTLEYSGRERYHSTIAHPSFKSPLTTCRRIQKDNPNPEPAGATYKHVHNVPEGFVRGMSYSKEGTVWKGNFSPYFETNFTFPYFSKIYTLSPFFAKSAFLSFIDVFYASSLFVPWCICFIRTGRPCKLVHHHS